jgi:NAD-dependent deacetylase
VTSPDPLPAGLREACRSARSVGVVTGAGVSVESGIPTYRGRGGIYDDPAEGDRVVEALSGPTLRRDPDRTWRVIAWKAGLARAARPNRAHEAIVEMERRAERFVLLTQNVDGLHAAAGSRNVIEIHGNTLRTRCTACPTRGSLSPEEIAAVTATPRCAACGAPLRPDVVLFEERLPEDELRRLSEELLERSPNLLVVAGTTALFPYVVEPVRLAASRGRTTVEVNPEETELSRWVSHSIRGRAGDVLPRLAEALPVRARERRDPRLAPSEGERGGPPEGAR